MPETRLWVSPAVPTVASLLLAALWGFSVFAGWGLEAFCVEGESFAACEGRLSGVGTVSSVFAAVGGLLTIAAWVLPWSRHEPARYVRLMSIAVAAWLIAEAVLFVGGELAT